MQARAPRGFRDILPTEARRREQLCFAVGSYFDSHGYGLIETPVVEELSVLESCSHCDVDNSFRFVDVDGSLLALRSDVTLPIARVVATRFRDIPAPYRLRYNADVFRERESLRGEPRHARQLGVELIGVNGAGSDAEVIELAIGAAQAAGVANPVVGLSHIGVFAALVEDYAPSPEWADAVLAAGHRGDFIEVEELVDSAMMALEIPIEVAAAIPTLVSQRGGRDLIEACSALVGVLSERAESALAELEETYDLLDARGLADFLTVDFSIMRSFSYYTGIVFEVYAAGVGTPLGGGGRYDRVLAEFGRDLPAAGFALELEVLERALALADAPNSTGSPAVSTGTDAAADRPLRIAVPKGLLFDGTVDLLERAGFDVDALRNPGRQLTVTTAQAQFVISKPTDVAIYVATGAADCGIGGRDILVEADYPLLELVDMRYGGCKFVVAQPDSPEPSLSQRAIQQGVIRVATKYPRLAQRFFDERGIQVDIVKLNGNIELAPLIGISDVIVDLTATGTTLRQNNLAVVEDVLSSTARFVANPASARTDSRVTALAATLYDLVREG